MRAALCRIFLLSLLVVPASGGQTSPAACDGFLDARWGMSRAEVGKFFAGAEPQPNGDLVDLTLTIAGGPTRTEFWFVDDRLVRVNIFPLEDGAEAYDRQAARFETVQADLSAEFGRAPGGCQNRSAGTAFAAALAAGQASCAYMWTGDGWQILHTLRSSGGKPFHDIVYSTKEGAAEAARRMTANQRTRTAVP